MKNKKGAGLAIGKIITFVLIIFVVVAVIFFIGGFGIPTWLNNLLPTAWTNNSDNGEYNFALECPVQVAKIVDERNIRMCEDEKCENSRDTELYLQDQRIWISENAEIDDEVGKRLRGSIVIYPEIIKGLGSKERPNAYYNVDDDLPPYEDLLNLNLAYFFTKSQLCQDKKITEEEFRKVENSREISIPTDYISSGKLYFNANEIIRNKGARESNLYLDKNLENVAKTTLDKDWALRLKAEEGQDTEPGYMLSRPIEPSEETTRYYDLNTLQEGQKTEYIKLTNPVNNQHNELGVDTGQENFEFIAFQKRNGRIYLQLLDKDWPPNRDDWSPWALIEYWDAHRSFARIPEWAKL